MDWNFDRLIFAAPLQGVTDAAWRNAHWAVFGGVDAYFAPFMRVERGAVRRRDLADVSPGRNRAPMVPQLLASPPAEAELMARTLHEMGHTLIDINLGCPHPPVARKGRGSGMLGRPDQLDAMCRALAGVEGVAYTVKMRLGYDLPAQWRQALPIVERLSPRHIAVHPRIGTQLYHGNLLADEFEHLLNEAASPVVFNGELRSVGQVEALFVQYPKLAGAMVGRGLAECPSLLCKNKCKSACYMQFHQALLEGERERMTGGEHQLLQHMKAVWTMMLPDADKRQRKRVLKARDMAQYLSAAEALIGSVDS